MKRSFLVVVAAGLVCGCVATKTVAPKADALYTVKTLRVVAVDGAPMRVRASSEADAKALADFLDASGDLDAVRGKAHYDTPSVGSLVSPLTSAPAPAVRAGGAALGLLYGAALLSEAEAAGKEVPGEAGVLTEGAASSKWSPSPSLARSAVEKLRTEGRYDAQAFDGYIKLPVVERVITWHMEDWLAPLRRYYAADSSVINYAPLALQPGEIVLEVGVLQANDYVNETLAFSVFVKLVDPSTKQVIGRCRQSGGIKTGPLSALLQDDALGMKRHVMALGDAQLATCLAELGVTGKP